MLSIDILAVNCVSHVEIFSRTKDPQKILRYFWTTARHADFSFKKNAWGLQPLEVGVSLFEAVADVVCLAVARDWPIWKFTARMEISGRRAHVESREGAADTQAGQNFA